jgi:hypothetical protein
MGPNAAGGHPKSTFDSPKPALRTERNIVESCKVQRWVHGTATRPWPPRSAPDTPPLRLSVVFGDDLNLYCACAGAAHEETPHPHDKQSVGPPPAGRSLKDPAARLPFGGRRSGPRRLERTPVAVHLLPRGEGKRSSYARGRPQNILFPLREGPSQNWQRPSFLNV